MVVYVIFYAFATSTTPFYVFVKKTKKNIYAMKILTYSSLTDWVISRLRNLLRTLEHAKLFDKAYNSTSAF